MSPRTHLIVHTVVGFFVGIALSACGEVDLSINMYGSNKLEGFIESFSSMSSSKVGGLSGCNNQKVFLYSLTSTGEKGELVSEADVDSEGHFTFTGLKQLGLDFSAEGNTTSHSIEFECGNKLYQRFVTGAKEQIISEGTTLMGWTLRTDAGSRVPSQKPLLWKSFYASIENASSLTEAYSTIISDPALRQKYQDAFGESPTQLLEAPPEIVKTTVPVEVAEGIGSQISVQANHWSLSYDIAFLWRINGNSLSQSSNFTYTPGANAQGAYTLQLFVGKDDGSGSLDVAKPYTQKTFTLNIENTIKPTVPSISLLSPGSTNSTAAQIRMNTGSLIDGRPQNCKSFSKLAIVEEAYPGAGAAPVLPSSYTVDCTVAGTQDVNVILSGSEGQRMIRVWAMDASQNISLLSEDVSLTYDNTQPSLTLTSLNGGELLKGGSTHVITWAATEAYPASAPISLEYSSDNGSNWVTIGSSLANTGSYNWTVPAVDSNQMRVRVSMVDEAGNTGLATSVSTFTVDSTAPSAPTVSRASASPSGSTSVGLTVTCLADYSEVYVSTSSVTPSASAVGWQACASSMNHMVATGDGLKTIYMWAQDTAGNVSTTSSNVTMTLDQTGPAIGWTNLPSGAQKGGSSFNLQFSVTEAHISTSQSYSIEYSADNGSSWTAVGSVSSLDGPLSSQSFSYNITWPSIDSDQVKLRIFGADQLGNSSGDVLTSTFTIDSTDPSISSFQLAGGATAVALPNVNYAISSDDSLSGVAYIKFSESSSFADSGWLAYAATGSLALSGISGDKTVYTWVKDAAGNVSIPSSYDISLDYGSPPEVTVTGPVVDSSYTTGQNVPITWSCSSSNGLDDYPIRIKVTSDDGTSFQDASGGWIANSGSYNWVLPSGVTAFRVLVECKSAAGVVASSFSNIINATGWSIFAGDPTDATENINATLALMAAPGNVRRFQSLATDAEGNIFYERGSVIMKIDALSGLATRFAGEPNNSSCTLQAGQDPLSTGYNHIGSPFILGANLSQDSLIFYSCGKIYLMNTSTRALSVLHSSPPSPGNFLFFSKTRKMYYKDSNRIYTLDLTSANNTPIHIYGDGTCSSSYPTVGSLAKNIPAVGTNASDGSPNFCQELYVFSNQDDSSIWIGTWGAFGGVLNSVKLDWDSGQSAYAVSVPDVGWTSQDWDKAYCHPSYVAHRVYCSSRHNSRRWSAFNLQSETWETPYDHESRIFIRYAPTSYGMVSLDSLNRLIAYQENPDGTVTVNQIGGQNIETYGNGTDLSSVAFSDVTDITYASTAQFLIVATANANLRKIDFSGSPVEVSTPTATNSLTTGSMNVDPSGQNLYYSRSWCARWYYKSVWNGTNYAAPIQFYNHLGCNSGTDISSPVADGTSVLANFPWKSWVRESARPWLHSNGKFYFFVKNRDLNQDAFIYSSDLSVINVVVGKVGTTGYNAADHGSLAVGATLNEVNYMTETSDGDLLILDNDRIRIVTITTESANPKIYDVVNLTLASGYTAGTTGNIMDAVYDASTELFDGSAVKGSGTLYYVTSSREVHKFTTTAVSGGTASSATDETYSFNGTSFSGNVRIALTPAGLLVTQPNKDRILKVAP